MERTHVNLDVLLWDEKFRVREQEETGKNRGAEALTDVCKQQRLDGVGRGCHHPAGDAISEEGYIRKDTHRTIITG
jgi:hypothetical protein